MNTIETKLTDLPYEVISHIITFLTYEDKKSLRFVCKEFYSITTEKNSIKSECFIIKDIHVQNIIRTLMKSEREFFAFEFLKVDFTEELMNIFNKYNNILSLSLIECNIAEKDFTKILFKCNYLQNLKISSCKSLFMAGVIFSDFYSFTTKQCTSLKSITFDKCSYLSDYILERFIIVCPNYESLSFNGTAISFHLGLCKRFYNENYTLENPANSVLTITFICNLLESNASKIKHLDFSNTNIDCESLQSICTMKNLSLSSLFLGNCREIRKSFELKLGDWQPNLIKLDLSSCQAVNNDSIKNICESMPNLVYLNISCCKNIHTVGLEHLRNLKKLTDLNISECEKITSNNLQFNLEYCPLKDFRCQAIIIYEHDIVPPTFLKHVRYLDLSYSTVTDNTLFTIFENCHEIVSLILLKCKKLTDNGFCGEGIHERSINNLRNLKCLNLDSCSLTDAILMYFNLPDLRECSLNFIKITSIGIESFTRRCNRLEELSLNDCDVDNDCIDCIVKLQRLHTLNLKNCWKLTDIAVDLIINHCKYLKELNLTNCRNITLVGYQRLLNMSSLQKLHNSMYSFTSTGQFNFPTPPCLPLL